MASFRVLQSLIQRGMHDELRARLERDAQLANAEDSDGRHLVHYAAIKSRAECLKVLLQHGGNPNAKASKESNATPLHFAARSGSLACVELLVCNGADLFQRTDGTNLTPKAMAAYQNMKGCKEYLDEAEKRWLKAKKEEETRRKAELKEACLNGDLNLIKSIVADSDDVSLSVRFHDGTNLLYLSAYAGHYPIVSYLINECDLRVVEAHHHLTKETPLHAACQNGGHLEIINLLLIYFPYLATTKSRNGEVALHLAARHNRKYIAKLLLQGKAILKVNPNDSILDIMKSGDWIGKPSADSGRSIHIHSSVLIINARNDLGETPLYVAAENGCFDIVNLFLHQGKGVDVKIATCGGRTALHAAAAGGHTTIAELLLEAGADVATVTMVDGEAVTPLVEAAGEGHLDTVRLLMKCNAEDRDGAALGAAQRRGHWDIVRAILARTGVTRQREAEIGVYWNQLKMRAFDAGCLETVVNENDCRRLAILDVSKNNIDELPTEIFRLTDLREFHASENRLVALPDDDWRCEKLEFIDVSRNRLVALPTPLLHLKRLSGIDASHNKIRELSSDIWLTPSLQRLQISNNSIVELPTALVARETVNVSGRSTPGRNSSGIGATRRRSSSSRLSSDPVRRTQRYNVGSALCRPLLITNRRPFGARRVDLTFLDVSSNQLRALPDELPCLAPRLEKLKASNNQIVAVAVPHGFPSTLKELILDGNHIEEFVCKTISSPVSPCPRSAVIPEMESVEPGVALRSVSKNKPCEHRQHKVLDDLRTLSLRHNRLKTENFCLSFPELVAPVDERNTTLRTMMPEDRSGGDTETTAATAVSASPLVFCPILKRLHLRENKLREVPTSVCKLFKLFGLDLSGNRKIVGLPLDMGRLKDLWDLNVDDLPLVDPPPNVVKKGTKVIVEFLWQKLKQAMPYRRLKLMLVGSHNKGKTTLMGQLTKEGQKSDSDGAFNNDIVSATKRTMSTVGIDIVEWTLGRRSSIFHRNTLITFMIWDFGGQEEYHATHQIFLSRRSLYLVVWSLADEMGGIEGLGQWLRNIESRAPSSAVIIVGTFLDFVPEKERNERLRKYRAEIRERYGEVGMIQAGFPIIYGVCFVNALNNDRHIGELRKKIFDTASGLREFAGQGARIGKTGEPRLLLDQHVPAGYIQIEERVTDVKVQMLRSGEVPVLTKAEFKDKILSDDHVSFVDKDVEDEVNAAVDFLHENGILLHFTDGSLANYYFLSPQWLCDMLAHIITVEEVNRWISPEGILDMENFKLIFTRRQFPLSMNRCYLDLLDKFEVAVQLDKNRLLVPSRLPAVRDDVHREKNDRLVNSLRLPLHRHYGLKYVPIGLWPRLISRLIGDKNLVRLLVDAADGMSDVAFDAANDVKWIAWKTGAELRWKNRPVARVAEIRHRLFAHRKFADTKLVQMMLFDSNDGEPTYRPYTSNRNVGIQIWVASRPSEIIAAAASHARSERRLPSSHKGVVDSVSLYHDGKNMTYSVVEPNDSGDFVTIDKESSFASSDPSSLFSSLSGSYGISSRPEPLAARLFTRCLERVNFLLEDWFHGLRREYDCMSLCPECLRAGLSQLETAEGRVSHPITFCVFDFKQCVQRAVDDDTIPCVEHGNIPLIKIVPDAVFGDLPQEQIIESQNLTRDKLIGEGGFASVYEGRLTRKTGRAFDHSETISVALKVFRGYDANRKEINPALFPDAIRSVRDELSQLSILKHDHVVRMLGISIKQLAVVLELAPLGSLNRVLDRYAESGRLVDAESSRDSALQVARGLAYLHANGVIYLDLKSANVLVWKFPFPDDATSDGVYVKLSDLGICRFAQPGGRVRALGGTPGFMAPEIIRYQGREPYDNKVDVFSYGMMLYELVTATLPMETVAPDEIDRAYVDGKRPPLQVRHMDERVFLRELMFCSWDQDPRRRPAATTIVEALVDDQFLRLVGGVRVVDGADIRCVCVRKRDSGGSPSESLRSSVDSYLDSERHTPRSDVDGPVTELWICCGDSNLGKIVVVSKAGRNLSQDEVPVASSCILSIVAVHGLVWVGTEAGVIRVIGGDSRVELCEETMGKNPVTAMVHSERLKRVVVGTGRGRVVAYADELSPDARLHLIDSRRVENRIVSCVALVDDDVWCGLNFAEIRIFDCETLDLRDVVDVVDEEKRKRESTRVSIIVSHMASTSVETTVFVFCVLTNSAVVRKIDAATRKIVGSIDIGVALAKRPFCADGNLVRVTALHCFNGRLYIGTVSGFIVVADPSSLDVSTVFSGFCNDVTFFVPISSTAWCLFPPGSEPSRLSTVRQSNTDFYLASFGDGLRGYCTDDDNDETDYSSTGFMLLWRVD